MESPPDDRPTFDDISPTGGLQLDEASAVKEFLGKTRNEAVELFHGPSFRNYEHLMWMGPRAFLYYLPSAVAAIQKNLSTNDCSAVPWLCSAIEFQIKCSPGIVPAATSDIRMFCTVMLEHWQTCDFDLEEDIDVLINRLLAKTMEPDSVVASK